ncbi:MAG: type II toxin-antitoxin system VapC family toxin [Candidatus Parabeggiatoa sp.]|nr:type II toxin-antitoxin system VapC family toxin [Candidatus Parabeggiatoa sp.]
MNLFLDACAIIYLIEAGSKQGETVRNRVTQHLKNNGTLSVSRLSLLECRVMPLKKGDSDLLARYEQFFELPSLKIIELTEEVVEHSTHLRVRYSLRTPDVLQAACAIMANADQFLTGDKQFLSVQELQVELV